MRRALPLATYALFSTPPALAAFNLAKEYSGTSFFNGWDFGNGTYDSTTHGHVNYLNQSSATSNKLAYVNDAGNAVLKVDDFSFVAWEQKRNSVRIESTDYFPVGSVIVFDATHLPFGCSVWPGFWTKGPTWPQGGEIDIVEAINLMGKNQMALHTQSGCSQPADAPQTGSTVGADCSAGTDSAAGCAVLDSQSTSFGGDFAAAGGGVWATQFDETGVFIWFWGRKDVPDTITNAKDTIDPSGWGTPAAAWPASSCDVPKFFTPQQLVIDITLCGDWAGEPHLYQQTCGGTLGNSTVDVCYIDNVINTNGTNYQDAYFEISSIKVFTVNNTILTPSVDGTSTILATTTATGGADPSPTGSSGTTSGNSTSTGSGSNSAVQGVVGMYAAMFGATALAVFSWVAL
ncbi:concanavalin A-like lectin/glucanase domain-containing protein [Lenzites betulinus]|nr:concanavalin A-like lectin/glucanase domain-containing protein [Lenzites betulinus]